MSPRVLVLASGSPRRAALLRAAGIAFEVGAGSGVDETPPEGVCDPATVVRTLAERKARAAVLRHPDALVLAADTLVFLDGEILGKPSGAREARRMLAALSGRSHAVATGVALAGPHANGGRRMESGAEVTRVGFRVLGPQEIEAYVASGEPMDKAGAYAIQGGAADFVDALDGGEDTVIGLPLGLVRRLLGRW